MLRHLSPRIQLCAALILLLLASLQATRASASIPASAALPVSFHPLRHHIGDIYGIGTYIGERYPRYVAPALARVRPTDVDWVREEFTADSLHRGSDAPYHFAPFDGVVKAEVGHGFNILGLLDYNNTWNGHNHAWMGHPQIKRLIKEFLLYEKAVVTHYARQIFYWQVWNEPDLHQFWGPFPDAKDYASLLRQSYSVIKAANPQAQVVMAGPSGADRNALRYIARVVAAKARFDQIAIQPYTQMPGAGLIAEVQALRKYHKPIWFSEMGWAGQIHCGPCGGVGMQARRLATTYALSAVNGVSKVFWYDFRDDGTRRVFPDHFGLVEYNFAGKPAYLAYEVGVYFLNRAVLLGVDHLTSSLTLYKLEKYGYVYYLAWNSDQRHAVAETLQWRLAPARALNTVGTEVSGSHDGVLHLRVAPDAILYLAGPHHYPPLYLPKGISVPPGHTK